MGDWEDLLEDEHVDALVEGLKQTNKVELEDAPVVEEVKTVPAPVPSKPKKKKIGEDFDKRSAEQRRNVEERTEPLDAAERRRREEEADHQLTAELFSAPPAKTELKTDEDYQNYAGEVSSRLAKGRPTKALVFFKELFRESASILNSAQLSEILRNLTVVQSEKVKAEKGPVKKSSNKKAALKGIDKHGKLMEGEEEHGDDLDEYGDFI
jgi:hypothetical protein